jgi:hypothetical protein
MYAQARVHVKRTVRRRGDKEHIDLSLVVSIQVLQALLQTAASSERASLTCGFAK